MARVPSFCKRCLNSRYAYGANLTLGEITFRNLKPTKYNQLSFGKLSIQEKEVENRMNVQ